MSKVLRGLPWLALGLLFLAFGLWVHQQMPVPIGTSRDTEIYSFDYLGYATTFSDFRFIGYGRFRHPLWGWFMSPLTLFGHRIYEIGEGPFWCFILSFFALVGVGCVVLVHRLLRRGLGLGRCEAFVCTALFASFAHVWLLAGMPETYCLSMLLSLAVVSWGLSSARRCATNEVVIWGESVNHPSLGRRLDAAGWGVLGVLAGGITITQSAKVALAFWVSHRLTRQRLFRVVLLVSALFIGVVGVFALRVWWRLHVNPEGPGWTMAWHTLVDNFAPVGLSVAERLRLIWVFFSEPILLRGEPFDSRVISGGYPSAFHLVLLLLLYGSVFVAVWCNRRHLLVRMLGAMFLVDVLIHFVAGWGLQESQLYAGHWFYALPLLVGLLFTRLSASARRGLAVCVGLLALALLVCNLQAYFGNDVGLEWPPSAS